MKPAGHAQPAKRPFNLLLNQATVQQAGRQRLGPRLSGRQEALGLGDAVVTALDELFSRVWS